MATNRGGRAEWERQQRAVAREIERERKETERARLAAEKEQKQQYRAARETEIENKNARLAQRITALNAVLASGLRRSARIDPRAEIPRPDIAPLDLGHLAKPASAPPWKRFAPRPPGALSDGRGTPPARTPPHPPRHVGAMCWSARPAIGC